MHAAYLHLHKKFGDRQASANTNTITGMTMNKKNIEVLGIRHFSFPKR